MEFDLTERLSALSHPQRMGIFRLLMRRCPDALPAGEIAAALNLKPSTASVYLSALTRAGLITQRPDATRLLYAVNLDTARAVVSDLFAGCCNGRADLCPPGLADPLTPMAPMADGQKYNVLFVCTGNSARSIFAETLVRDLAGDRFIPFSAGIRPQSRLNPYAVELLQATGHDTAPLRPKAIAAFRAGDAPEMDFVLTVCDRAANAPCPPWPGRPVSGHWGVPDPVKTQGTEADRRLAFDHAYGALRNRIGAFAALSPERLDRASLQRRIDEIGKMPCAEET
ncbi:helix-turn-helix domain-containing protein [Sulfitobacter sabulilitoris]|uniref:MarR family transcriptional regulator n=1 Tax=Sulfitobacter sabulilitoris TaxID=2562655 RepID=A0A5S3PII9_9RHOB|nr:helix-turn-helix domain-containing protein [Sulfitobacter sabulilitoris]TMM54184.1 MarR family transcriptional regulator [Sulfitobacter sabulilitoris]